MDFNIYIYTLTGNSVIKFQHKSFISKPIFFLPDRFATAKSTGYSYYEPLSVTIFTLSSVLETHDRMSNVQHFGIHLKKTVPKRVVDRDSLRSSMNFNLNLFRAFNI